MTAGERSTAGTAPPRRSTRSTRSTRPVKTEPVAQAKPQASNKRVIRREPVAQLPTDSPQPRVRKSTRHAAPSAPTRTVIQSEKRQEARFKAPVQFVAVMFGVVIVSVFAFSLLQESPQPSDTAQTVEQEQSTGERVKFEGPGSTSTNTGILRGKGSGGE